MFLQTIMRILWNQYFFIKYIRKYIVLYSIFKFKITSFSCQKLETLAVLTCSRLFEAYNSLEFLIFLKFEEDNNVNVLCTFSTHKIYSFHSNNKNINHD